jgi:predicted nucleotidyltransferase
MRNPFPQELYDFFDEMIKKHFQNQEVRIYLFGSRAREDHHPRSDYDLGIKFPYADSTKKNQFILDCQENIPTLCGIDLVDIEEANPDLQTKIKREGILIYGSKEKREFP